MNIVIVEDEDKLAAILSDYLVKAGYTTHIIADGTIALQEIKLLNPELVLLDIMLPGTDGISLCRKIRKDSNVPIIMTTARAEEIDRLLGLESGADDYICKPYSPREVVARVKAVLRRGKDFPAQKTTDANFSVNIEEAMVNISDKKIELTAVELKLLQTMADTPGRIYNRNQLMSRIYPDNRVVSDRTIDSHVKKLRQKLAALDAESEYIHSVYGLGYKFEYPQQSQHL